jgi:hypothetical protein
MDAKLHAALSHFYQRFSTKLSTENVRSLDKSRLKGCAIIARLFS